MKKWLWRILRLVLLAYLVALAGLFFFQEKLLFHPNVLQESHKFELRLAFEEKTFNVGDVRLHSVLVRAKKQPARGLLLMFHGNAGSMEGWSLAAEELAEKTGFDAWILDYPGFGKSGGSIRSEAQLHEAAKVFYELGVKEKKSGTLIVYGRSIGSGIAVRVAAENKVDGLILESPYLSIRSIAANLFPWIPVSLLLRYPLRSDEWMPKVTAPILVLHGENDTLIPIESGRELAKLNPKARFVEIPGAGHNDVGESDLYWAELGVFLK